MKKIILATVLLVALISPAFAGEKDEASKLLNDLKAALKNASQVQRTSTDAYDKATFSFNGQPVSAFYNAEDGTLIGFSRHISVNDMPMGAAENIQKEYPGWAVTDAIMFIASNARTTFFAEVFNGKNRLALEIAPDSKVSIYAKMPS